jgi:hypothetical protein
LFQVGDKIPKVETLGLSSRLVCWRLWQNVEFQQSWQLNISDEQTFSPLQKKIQDLILVAKGKQQEFFE